MDASKFRGSALLALALCACASDIEIEQRSALIEITGGFVSDPPPLWDPAIVGGQPHDGDPAVALLVALDADEQILGICSATLIAPRRLLTAAHCIDGRIPGVAGFAAYFGTELSETDPGFVFLTSAEQVVVHPRWDPDRLEAGHDIGLVFLRDPVPIEPMPIRTAPLADADIGAAVTLVGWGLTGSGAGDDGRKRLAISSIKAFDPLLVQVGDGAVGTCNGDSGGPAFLDGEVAGVTSFGDVDCAQISVDTRVDAFDRFIVSDGQELDDPGQPCDCPAGQVCADGVCVPDDDNAGPGTFPPLPDDDGGCAVSAQGSSTGLILLVAVLLATRRRRPPRPSCVSSGPCDAFSPSSSGSSSRAPAPDPSRGTRPRSIGISSAWSTSPPPPAGTSTATRSTS